ncbi:P-loop containing nucleoside triphosphate hydrolase protein [Thozetella sp. PMI_491]|nr:P-loop containing nucleoside triphosphate hydrolase protein [Thozetella sp. PMI_491]
MTGTVGRRTRTPRALPGIDRADSDDELGTEDHPWEWIYEDEDDEADAANETTNPKKRKRATAERKIVAARMGDFECRVGDTVLLKAEGSNEAWVGIICEFTYDEEEDEKAANFMWFSTEKEIRNSEKKRKDFLWNELYVSPSWDMNPLATINGKAVVMSPEVFKKQYPTGKIPRKAKEFGKVFVCRRGCNTRTATYTDEFIWEDVYHGKEDIDALVELVRRETKATRKTRQPKASAEDKDYVVGKDEDPDEKLLRTPKKPRTQGPTTPSSKRRTPGKSVAGTPSSARKIREKRALEFTPLATRVLSPSMVQSSPYQLARSQLHVAAVPASLPCREGEFARVYSHLEAAVTAGTGTCIYISGVPGTGKTATVREVVSQLDKAVADDELDDFIYVEINGMRTTEPQQAYSLLWEGLKGQRVSPKQALDLLEHEFSHPSPRRVPCVVLMDELDQLATKNQGVMYNFFNWPALKHSRLIVLAVANTMDLPERTLSNRISSRLGLIRITFPGYTHDQLMKIVQSRLEGVPGGIVKPEAVQFASRKVAAVSGDARRALDICRRAVELAEAEVKGTVGEPGTPSKRAAAAAPAAGAKPAAAKGVVTIETIRRAINEATSSPLQQVLRALPFASRVLLAAFLARIDRSGVAESTFGDVLEEMQRCLKFGEESKALRLLDHRQRRIEEDDHEEKLGRGASRKVKVETRTLRPAGLSNAAVALRAAGILKLEGRRAHRPNKMRLTVGDGEVRLAFKDDPEIKAVGFSVQ